MKFTQVILSLAFSAAALGSVVHVPTTLDKRATTICGQWDTATSGSYILYQDLWGEASATSGSQCSTLTSVSGTTAVWSTSWTWAGGAGSVKSYANIQPTTGYGQKISAIKSIASTWKYSYTGSNIIADVSYDIFTSASVGGANAYEIMIWLAALGGAGPISSTGSKIATVTIDSVSWNLFSGPNGATTVYSFVAASQVTNFSGDLLAFFTYLKSSYAFPTTTQYLVSIGAGTEPFSGTSAVFSTSAFSLVIAT